MQKNEFNSLHSKQSFSKTSSKLASGRGHIHLSLIPKKTMAQNKLILELF